MGTENINAHRVPKYPPKLLCISIDMEKTGTNIKNRVNDEGYSIDDIMKITGVSSKQAVYKWFSGKSIPGTEIQIILCKILGIGINDLIVTNGEHVI